MASMTDSIKFRNFKNHIDRNDVNQKRINQQLLLYIEFLSKQNEQMTKVITEQQNLIIAIRDGTDKGFKELAEFINSNVLPALNKEDSSKE